MSMDEQRMEITAQGLDTPGPAVEEVVERASPRSTSSNREMYEEQRLILTVDPVDKDRMKDVSPMLSESASISPWWDQRGDLLAEPLLRSRKTNRSPNKEAPKMKIKMKKDKSSPTIINTKEIEGVIMNKLKKRTEEMEKFISANKNVHGEIKRMAGEIKALVRRAIEEQRVDKNTIREIEEQKIEEQRRFESKIQQLEKKKEDLETQLKKTTELYESKNEMRHPEFLLTKNLSYEEFSEISNEPWALKNFKAEIDRNDPLINTPKILSL
ncbi:hypothetical protein FQR65_LT15725 [Abscondita terminalis]|nr:hypothetical protein FQR65_LT15725 [Abscondita terminalis]